MPASDDNVPVTVVMPIFNGEKYLDEAIRSIRSQDMNAFRLVMVDDASTDRSFEIASAHAASDPRIRVVRLDQNIGNFAARNRGIAEGVGDYIAVMDSDDFSLPNRLSVQLAFMQRHPDYMMIAGGVDRMDGTGKVYRRQTRARDAYEVFWYTRFDDPMVHPAVMFRRRGPQGQEIRYSERSRSTQDYRLLTEVLDMGGTATIADVVLRYRVHRGQISDLRQQEQSMIVKEIATGMQKRDLTPDVFEAIEPFRRVYYDRDFRGAEDVRAMARGFRKLVAFDASRRPDRRVWIEREAAWLLSQAIFRAVRMPTIKRDLSIFRSAPTLAMPLLLRRLESAGILPSFLRVDPRLAT